MAEQSGMPPIVDVGVGAVKGAARTAVGLGELVSKIPGVSQTLDAAYGPGVRARSFDWAREHLKPTNTAQAVGQGVEQIGEFFAPGAGLAKMKTAAKTGIGLLDTITGMGLEGASAAAVDAAQKGTPKDALKTGALTAGAGLTLQGAAKMFQKGAGWIGEASEKALLKPGKAALEGQTPTTMVRNLFKYDAGGTLGQSFEKVNERIGERVAKLRAVLGADPAARVDLKALGDETLKSFMGNKQAVAALDRIREGVEFGLNERGVKLRNGVLDLADANVAKQAVGEMGAWLKDAGGKTVSDADRVTEKVANAFYRQLKSAIEKQATGDVAAINRELSELIPIRSAIIERIPVADRANVLNLADIAGLASGNLGLSLANRMFQSGRAANLMQKAGKADIGPTVTAAARLTGASQ